MPLLYAHAQKIVDEDKSQTGLWLGTGSTKTRIALMLARGSTLVVCPKTQREDRNWKREVAKIKKEKKDFSIDMTVMSNEEFKKSCKLGLHKRFRTVIVDEAHKMLGATPSIKYVKRQPVPKCSQMFDELQRFVSATRPERLYLLTATPTRSPMCIWAAAKILGRNWDFYKFRDAFYVRLPMPGREVWSPRKDSATKDRLAKLVQSLGYTGQLTDWFDVPPQVFTTKYLELTEKQAKRIKTIKFEFPDPLVLVGKRHQIENGVLAGDRFNASEIYPSQKIDAILDLASEFPRLVIFAKYTQQIAMIAQTLRDDGYKVLTLEGSTKDRGSLLLEANMSDRCIFIAQSSISSGWELPGPTKEHPEFKDYPVMVFASLSYLLTDRIQGIGRILRASGLKKNLYIDLVVRGGIDEAVKKAVDSKVDFHERIFIQKK